MTAMAVDIPTIRRLAEREMDRRLAARAVDSLAAFVRLTWQVLERGRPLQWNWHIDLICKELEAVTRGEVLELVICIPPGLAKSRLVSVMWPAWEWLHAPWLRALYVSASDDLAKRDSLYTRQLIESEEYQFCLEAAHRKLGTPLWSLDPSQNEKHHFGTTERGFRQALSMGAGITGKRGDKLVIDDPLDAKNAVIGTPEQVTKRMQEVVANYDGVLASRLNDPERQPRVTIMQRLAEGDLAGTLIERGVRSVVLPMEYDPEHPNLHPDDPRTEKGEPLFPARMSTAYIDRLKLTPGSSRYYPSQYQQQPTPLGGGVFKRKWLRYYKDQGDHYLMLDAAGKPRASARKADCWRIVSCDVALTEKSMSDYTVIQVWDVVRVTGDMVLIHQWRDQAEAPAVEDELLLTRERFNPVFVGIEDTTASKAIIQRLRKDGVIVKGFKPTEYGGDKVARAFAASIRMEEGKVHLPLQSDYLADLESELLNFPGVAHDDITDCLVYAVIFAADRNLYRAPKPKKLPPNSLGAILGMEKVFSPPPKDSAFALDTR